MTMRADQVADKGRLRGFDRRLAPDTYLTDGSNLFRCISVDRTLQLDAVLVLEDCRTLEVILLPLTDLLAASMRIVKQSQRAKCDPTRVSSSELSAIEESLMGAPQTTGLGLH